MAEKSREDRLNLTIVALVALVAIVSLAAIVLNGRVLATQQNTLSAQSDGNTAGNALKGAGGWKCVGSNTGAVSCYYNGHVCRFSSDGKFESCS